MKEKNLMVTSFYSYDIKKQIDFIANTIANYIFFEKNNSAISKYLHKAQYHYRYILSILGHVYKAEISMAVLPLSPLPFFLNNHRGSSQFSMTMDIYDVRYRREFECVYFLFSPHPQFLS
jgi:hypothetical protein